MCSKLLAQTAGFLAALKQKTQETSLAKGNKEEKK